MDKVTLVNIRLIQGNPAPGIPSRGRNSPHTVLHVCLRLDVSEYM